MNAIFQLLNPTNTMSVNRMLAHSLGVYEALVYSSLVSKYYYYCERNMLNDGWFYSTIADLQESTTLKEKQQKRIINNLIEAGLIRSEIRGMPARRSFQIIEDLDLIAKYISEGEAKAASIKPAASELYKKKQQERTPQQRRDFLNLVGLALGGVMPVGAYETVDIPHNEAVSVDIAEASDCLPSDVPSQSGGTDGTATERGAEPHNIYKSKDNKTKVMKSYHSINPAHESKTAEKTTDRIDRTEYRKQICTNIEYDLLIENHKSERSQINELVDIMLDVICSNKAAVRVNGCDCSKDVVKSQFLKLNYSHMEYVLTALKKTPSNVKNIRAYLITVLYNAPLTMENFYSCWVNYDMNKKTDK